MVPAMRRSMTVLGSLALVVAGWSPASAGSPGGPIAYTIDRGAGQEIDAVNPDGTHPRVLVPSRDPDVVEAPDWSPQGSLLTYFVTRPHTCTVMLARRDGTATRNLTGRHRGCDTSPAFGPGGHRIFFANLPCETCRTWISSMDLRGHDRQRIRRIPRENVVEDVDVSPDGRTIAYVLEFEESIRPYRRGLFTIGADGHHPRRIAPYRLDVGAHFGWSPDGGHLVFTSFSQRPPGHEPNVVRIRPDGTHAVRLTHVRRPGLGAGGATYAASAPRIVYRLSNDNIGRSWLVVMHSDGSHKNRIRAFASPVTGTAWAPH